MLPRLAAVIGAEEICPFPVDPKSFSLLRADYKFFLSEFHAQGPAFLALELRPQFGAPAHLNHRVTGLREEDGVLRSDDYGHTWRSIAKGLPFVSSLRFGAGPGWDPHRWHG